MRVATDPRIGPKEEKPEVCFEGTIGGRLIRMVRDQKARHGFAFYTQVSYEMGHRWDRTHTPHVSEVLRVLASLYERNNGESR